jgi:hypothetical protein
LYSAPGVNYQTIPAFQGADPSVYLTKHDILPKRTKHDIGILPALEAITGGAVPVMGGMASWAAGTNFRAFPEAFRQVSGFVRPNPLTAGSAVLRHSPPTSQPPP